MHDTKRGTRTEPAEWKPPSRLAGKRAGALLQSLRDMGIGETLRVEHDTWKCGYKPSIGVAIGKTCALAVAIYRLRKQGRQYEYYHESHGVAVVRRTA